MWLVVAACVLPAAAEPLPGQVDASSPHYELEVAYGEAKSLSAFQQLEQRIDGLLAEAKGDADLYWMKARAMFEQGELIDRDAGVDMVAHYQEMADAADTGLELRPNDPHLRFARGIALARLGTTKGVLSSLFLARDVEADWLVATQCSYASVGQDEVLPNDAYQALGVFYRLVPDWWIVQVIAGTRGDLDKSLEMHEKATAGRPSIDSLKELGVTELCIAETRDDEAMRARAMKTFARALSMPAQTEKNRIDHDHIGKLEADPSMACEYSRDGQQDLDKKKLAKD